VVQIPKSASDTSREVVADFGITTLGLIELLRRTIGTAIDLSTALAPDLCPTVADPGQVESAVVNLVINARDAGS
jgi:hypothetical protein